MNHSNILLVDDEPNIRLLLSAVLQSKGYSVDCAEDGFVALRKIRLAVPDLIISDLRMPNMSGFELLAIVRTEYPDVPVIAISGEFVSEGVQEVLADAFFQKSHYSPSDLLDKVAELLTRPRRLAAQKKGIPVWAPTGDASVMVTCTKCLKSFPIDPCDEIRSSQHEIECVFCGALLQYRLLAITRSA
jgi:CheY-like chemotaxis protein